MLEPAQKNEGPLMVGVTTGRMLTLLVAKPGHLLPSSNTSILYVPTVGVVTDWVKDVPVRV